MSLIKKFFYLNSFKNNYNYYNLICCNKNIGYVHKDVAKDIFLNINKVSCLNKSLYLEEKKFVDLNLTAKKIANLLLLKNKIEHLSGELFSCRENMNGKEFFHLDRALVEMLGIRGYGVHLIAYTKQGDSYKIWVPKRNKTKLVEPSKLDNTVAGGVKAGENVYQALRREAREEAGITKQLMKKVKLVGTINYSWKNKTYSIRRDTLYLFDLEVDKKFIPKCNDGEVETFRLMDWKKVLKIIQETNHFKRNCALVMANFLIRHGLLTNRNEKNYEEILRFN